MKSSLHVFEDAWVCVLVEITDEQYEIPIDPLRVHPCASLFFLHLESLTANFIDMRLLWRIGSYLMADSNRKARIKY